MFLWAINTKQLKLHFAKILEMLKYTESYTENKRDMCIENIQKC